MKARWLLAGALLGCLGGCRKDTDAWIAQLSDAEPFARTLAAIAVRDAPTAERRRVVEALAEMLLIEEDETARRQGEASLARLAAVSPAVLIELITRPESLYYRDSLVAALAKAGDAARPALLAALSGGGSVARSALARALARTGGPAIEQLVDWAGDGEPGKLATAMAGLEAVGLPGQQLIPGLAARLLADLDDGGRWPRQTVLAAVRDASEQSAVAAWALALAVEKATPARRESVLAAVVRGVARGMVHERKDNPAAGLIGHLGERAVPHLVDAVLEAEDSRVKRWAAISLAALGPGSVAAMLGRGVDDRWVVVVVNGLGEPGRAALRAAADSGDDVVRRAARRLLRR